MNAAGEELCAPGERYLYSNEGYSLLSQLVAVAARLPFRQYVLSKIVEPLGLKDTDFSGDRGDVATGYTVQDGEFRHHPQLGGELVYGPGGLIGSARDLVRFARFVMSGGEVDNRPLIPREVIEGTEEIHVEYPAEARSGFGERGRTGYGYGWRVRDRFLGHKLIMHAGSTGVSGAQLLIVPEQKIAVGLLANVGSAPIDLAVAILAECLGEDPDTVVPGARMRTWTDRICGEYRMYLGQGAIDVQYDEGLITVRDKESGRIVGLVPAEDSLSSGRCYQYDRFGGRSVCQSIDDADPPVLYIERNRYRRVDAG